MSDKDYLWLWDRDQVIIHLKSALVEYMNYFETNNIEKWWNDPKHLDDVGENIVDNVFSEDMDYIEIYER
tara:strand:+ start:5299 stop:5508 length:210 start_codon:yes stop_codon:yes gene_type:complete